MIICFDERLRPPYAWSSGDSNSSSCELSEGERFGEADALRRCHVAGEVGEGFVQLAPLSWGYVGHPHPHPNSYLRRLLQKSITFL
ncbi:hypothetical protein DY000_02018131 [Brassica cretica]|uniref:Histone deacetylase n=1 Tax=Brassica cretica TaxID=69181 RepID=A0ABQ7D6G0_BRACR|nr:hypothetical protein DY000_02018131 [Brassica cretica]